MFSKIFFCLLLLGATVLAQNADQPHCNINEVFKECGTACESSCDNLSPTCTQQCIPDVCQCAPGFVRSDQGCIPSNQCNTTQSTCGPNEVLKECGSACEPSCQNLSPICTQQCIPDVCQCASGYVRTTQGCIPVKKCPKNRQRRDKNPHGTGCGTNEEFKSCGTTCEPTCTEPNPICNKMCQLDVCQCKTGYLRDGSGECVLSEKCNPCEQYECPAGQHCEPKIVQCVRAPCPPLPNCVDNA